MDPQVSASFIPKKPLVQDSRPRSGASLLTLVAVLIFIASLVAAGATFAYTQYLKRSITAKSASLERAQSAYDPGVIEDLVRLDERLSAGKTLLAEHLSPSAIFSFLSIQTLEQVQLNSFSLDIGEDGSGALELTGEAASFSTIALQSDQFGASKVLKDLIFSDLVISPETGRVTFSVSAKVDPSLLLYSKNLGVSPIVPSGGESAPAEEETIPEEQAEQSPSAEGATSTPQ